MAALQSPLSPHSPLSPRSAFLEDELLERLSPTGTADPPQLMQELSSSTPVAPLPKAQQQPEPQPERARLAPQNLFIDAADEWNLILTRNDSQALSGAYRALYSSIGVIAAFLLGHTVSDVGDKNPEFNENNIWGDTNSTELCDVYQALLGCNFVATMALMIWSMQMAAQLAQTPDEHAKGLMQRYGFYRVQGGWFLLAVVVVLFLASQMLKVSIACSRTVFVLISTFMVTLMLPLAWQSRSVVMIKQDYLRELATVPSR